MSPDNTPEKGNTPRVSDADLKHAIDHGHAGTPEDDPITYDLVDARARIAELERDLQATKRERDGFRDLKPGRASQRRQIMRLRHGDQAKAIRKLCSRASAAGQRARDAEARADRLAVENAELRTLGTREDVERVATAIAVGLNDISVRPEWNGWEEQSEAERELYRIAARSAIRARLAAPAEPVPNAPGGAAGSIEDAGLSSLKPAEGDGGDREKAAAKPREAAGQVLE